MPIPNTPKQLCSLTPITIMLASSIFMLVYSVFEMIEINTVMLETVEELEHTTKIHSSIYTGITKRSNALFMLIKTADNKSEIEKFSQVIENEKKILLNNQLLCIHNKGTPINKIFIQQAKMLNQYSSIEKQVLDLANDGEEKAALSLYSTRLITHKEATLNQIIKGSNFIRASSTKKIKTKAD